MFFEVGLKFVLQRRVIGERHLLGAGLEEEIEGIGDRHFGDEIYLDQELLGLLRENKAREIVGLRVLLPVEEVLLGRDLQRITEDRGAAVGRRAQADDLRTKVDELVVAVVRAVRERDLDCHRCCCGPRENGLIAAAFILHAHVRWFYAALQ